MAPLCYTSLPEALYDPQACPLAIARYQYIKRNNQSTAVHSHETERPLNKLPTIWQQYSRKPDIHYQNHSDKQQNKKETCTAKAFPSDLPSQTQTNYMEHSLDTPRQEEYQFGRTNRTKVKYRHATDPRWGPSIINRKKEHYHYITIEYGTLQNSLRANANLRRGHYTWDEAQLLYKQK